LIKQNDMSTFRPGYTSMVNTQMSDTKIKDFECHTFGCFLDISKYDF